MNFNQRSAGGLLIAVRIFDFHCIIVTNSNYGMAPDSLLARTREGDASDYIRRIK